jgi:hypothetical protein
MSNDNNAPDDKTTSEDGETDNQSLKWLTPPVVIVIIIVYVVLWAVYGSIVYKRAGSLANAGLFGDMFGAFNALVSGIAMLGVVAAILLQRDQNRMQAKELKAQLKELEETRDELKKQRTALEQQNVHAKKQAEAAETQLRRWNQDYIVRNKPVVFCDRVEQDRNHFNYVMRNVGGGFAVNVYFIDTEADPGIPPLALGSLAANAERTMPPSVNDRLVAAGNGLSHIIIAEGPWSRTRQWTPTLNFRTPDFDIRRGHVQHRLADIPHPSPSGKPQPLSAFVEKNRAAMLEQLGVFGVSGGD